MRKQKKAAMEGLSLLSREVVEATARIIGPFSAAGQALKRADEIGPAARFWSTGNSIIVTDGIPS